MSKRSKQKRNTAESARHRAEGHKVGFEQTVLDIHEETSMFRLKSTKPVRIDIIPYEVGAGNPWADEGTLHYERTFFVHRGIGADRNSYVCPRKTADKKCFICDYRAKLMKDPEADEDLVLDLAPKERQLFNIVDISDRDKGVQIWDMSFHLFGKALDAEIRNADEEDEYANFAEIDGGSTLKLGISESSFAGFTFFSVESIGFKSRKKEYDDSILEEVTNLDDALKILSYDELKSVFLQTEEEEDGEKPKSRKKSKKSQAKEEDKEEDKDEDGAEELDVGDRVTAEISGETYAGKITKIKDGEATVKFDDGDADTFDLDDLTAEEEAGGDDSGDDNSGDDDFDDVVFDDFGDDVGDDSQDDGGIKLEDLEKDDNDDDFDSLKDEIEERCKNADIDSDDFSTWKETELVVRHSEAKKKSSKKATKKSKKKSKK